MTPARERRWHAASLKPNDSSPRVVNRRILISMTGSPDGNFRNKPLLRYAAEAAAIVASILLAFTIDAWWEERQERELEQETLQSLKIEFERHLKVLEGHKFGHGLILQSSESLQVSMHTGVWNAQEYSIDGTMWMLRAPLTTDLGSGVRDSLISAGRIDILSDLELRYELAEWDSVLDELLDDQLGNSKVVHEITLPYMVRWGVPMGIGGTNLRIQPTPDFTRMLSANEAEVTRLLKDPSFRTIVESRSGKLRHTIEAFDDTIVAANSILDKIDAALVH